MVLVLGGLHSDSPSNNPLQIIPNNPQKIVTSPQKKDKLFAPISNLLMSPCNLDFTDINILMEDFTECGQAASIIFSADINTLTDLQTTLNIPADFVFKNNLIGATLISTTPLIIHPTIIAQKIQFSFDLQAQCNASDMAQIEFLFDFTGGNSSCQELSLEIPVRDVAVSIAPEGTRGRNTEGILDAILNKNDTLIATIVQEGVGVLDSLFYYVDNHPLMSLEKVMDCTNGTELNLAFTIGDRNYYWVGEQQTSIDGTDGFVRNEGIDICEVWNVTTCPDSSIPPVVHGVSTSCGLNPNNDICQNDNKTVTLDFVSKRPEILHEIDTSIPYDPTCIGTGLIKQSWILVNSGTAPAGNVSVYLTEYTGSTPIDVTSITYRIGKNSSPQALPENEVTNRYDSNIPNCVNTAYANSDDLKSRMWIHFDNTNLPVGDTLYFDYLVYPIPCTCSSCDVRRRLGTDIADMNVYTLCNDLVQNEILRSEIAWPYFDVDIASFMETPVTTADGAVSAFSNTISSYNNAFLTNQGYNRQDDDERTEVYFNNGGGCSDCYFEAVYVLPNGLDWAGSAPSDITWRDDDGTVWHPTEVDYTDHNGGTDTLVARWIGQEAANFDPFNESSGIFFDYTPDCDLELAKGTCTPLLYADVITRTFYWSSGDCSACPKETLECEEPITVVIRCPGVGGICQCDGFVQTYANAERKNLYQPDPDNNGRPNTGGAYDENLIRRDRFLKGDSIEVNMGGYISASGTSFSNFDYIYAIVDFPNNEFTPIGGQVTVYENGGATYTCDVLTQQIVSGNKLVTDLSIERLVANGCGMPSTYEGMDSIALTFYYTTTEAFVGEIQQLTYRTSFFASDEPYGGAEYNCRLPIDYRLTQVGTQSSFDYYNSGLRGFEGCSRGTPYYRGYSRIGSRSIDFFPGEYVDFIEQITQFQANIPAGLVLDYFRIYIRRKNASGTNNLGSRISGFPSFTDIRADHPAITIVGNQLYLDMATFLQAQTGSPDYPFSDEGYSWSLQPYFIATCDLAEGAVENATMLATHSTNEDLFCSTGYTFEDTRTDLRYDGGAEIIVEADNGTITIDQFPTRARIRVSNNGNAVANNTWLTLNNQSGKLIIQAVKDITGGSNTVVTPNSFGLYELGDFAQNSQRLYEVTVFANVCDTDSLNITSGYDCTSYPSNIESALCSSQDVINFNAVAGSLTMIAKAPASEVTLDNLCDTVTYVVDLNAAGAGYLHDLKVDIQLPLDVDIIPGSFEIAYPTTATSVSIPPNSEFEPATDAIHLYGTTYQFDVTGNDATLATDGLIGSAGSAFNANVVNFRFKAVTACGYGSGSRIFFEASGTEGCGNPLVPLQLDFSEKVNILGVPAPFISEISALPDTLSACGGGSTTLDISYDINGTLATQTEDSIRIILPPGLTYVPNSYNQGTSPFANPPVVEIKSGLQVLYWGISGLNPSDDASFSFDIQASDIGQTCKDYQFIVQTFKSAQAKCSATNEFCSVRSISDEEIDNIYIDKPSLAIEVVSATSMAAGLEEMVMIDFKIENIGSVETNPGNVVKVDLYADIDKNGRIDKTIDLFLSQIDIDLTLSPREMAIVEGTSTIPAQYSCGFLAVLDITKNCICSQVTSGVIHTDLDLKLNKDITVCSNEAQQIGPDNSFYTYEWVGLDGADLTAIFPNATTSPATFQYDNNTGQAIVWEYGLSIIRGTGCYTFDTIQVTIQPETTGNLTTTLCAPITDCGETDAGFQLSGPTIGSNHQWTIQNGDLGAVFQEATNPLTNITSTLSTTTTFQLDYLDANGCPAEFEQTVSLINCACTSLGDTVWLDLNVNGIQEDAEPGISGITVYLYKASNLTDAIQTTTTNAAGYYIFQPLSSANYVVRFDTTGQSSPYHLF